MTADSPLPASPQEAGIPLALVSFRVCPSSSSSAPQWWVIGWYHWWHKLPARKRKISPSIASHITEFIYSYKSPSSFAVLLLMVLAICKYLPWKNKKLWNKYYIDFKFQALFRELSCCLFNPGRMQARMCPGFPVLSLPVCHLGAVSAFTFTIVVLQWLFSTNPGFA